MDKGLMAFKDFSHKITTVQDTFALSPPDSFAELSDAVTTATNLSAFSHLNTESNQNTQRTV